MTTSQQTILYEEHKKAGAKLVDFAGWQMPLHYGSQLEEHHQVRQHAGIFDVSHMNVVQVQGAQATAYLQHLLANNIVKLNTPDNAVKALYSCMLNENGGVIDDLIAYKRNDNRYWLIFNAATRATVMPWIAEQAISFDVSIAPLPHLAMLAVQGPQARQRLQSALAPNKAALLDKLPVFTGVISDDWLIARTGYTGEDGVEIILPATEAVAVWRACLAAGIRPCGLGARDTLRLEAGMNLYGNDMDESVTPLESGLAWTIAWEPEDRDFIGRDALTRQREQGVPTQLVGVVLEERGVLRAHQTLTVEGIESEGIITSGSFSPTLGHAIAMARLPNNVGEKQTQATATAAPTYVMIRGKRLPVRRVKLPFVRHGKKVFV